jgi:hypothetical protein
MMSLPVKVTAGDNTVTECQVSNRVVPNSNRPFASAKRLTKYIMIFCSNEQAGEGQESTISKVLGNTIKNFFIRLFRTLQSYALLVYLTDF